MSNIRLIATIVAKEGYENDVLSICVGMIEPSRQDEGCLQYELNKDTSHPGTFIFLEVWENQSAVDKHNETAHMKSFIKNLNNKVDVIDIKFIEKIA